MAFDGDDDRVLQVQLLTANARAPQRQTMGAAGYDLYSVEDVVVSPGTRLCVSTGIAMALPMGTYGRVAPRSSLSLVGIDVGAGVIDGDYRGEVKVLIVNNGTMDAEIKAGSRIAQLIIEVVATPSVQIVDVLRSTERGEGGFGSTGY